MVTMLKTATDQDAYFCHYPRQINAQGQFIELDIRTGEVSASYNPEIGGAVPFTVWHGVIRRYHMPANNLTADCIHEIMDSMVDLLERVYQGGEEMWNGNNMIGVLNEDATDAEQEIEARLMEPTRDLPKLQYINEEED